MTTKEYNCLCKKYNLIPYYERIAADKGDDYSSDYTLVDAYGVNQCICGYRNDSYEILKQNTLCLYKNGQAYVWYDAVKDAEKGLLKRMAEFKQEFKQARLKEIMSL